MKFDGEIKFPDVDHPGVPVAFLIGDSQAEIVLDGEPLGRWSLFDVQASRLVGQAFEVDLDGTKITFLAKDPIDFAYRGVEHMAEVWATLKSKSLATRGVAVRKSRKGTVVSRLDDLRAAMIDNLAGQVPPPPTRLQKVAPADEAPVATEPKRVDVASMAADAPSTAPTTDDSELARLRADLDAEREELATLRRQLEIELREAEQRESDRVEAFRVEMQRLESERRALEAQRLGVSESELSEPETPDIDVDASSEPDVIPESVIAAGENGALATDAPADGVDVDDEPDTPQVDDDDDEPGTTLSEQEPPTPEDDPEDVVDLSGIEAALDGSAAAEAPEPEPAMAAAGDSKAGLMGAVRSAFTRGGGRTHEHVYVEAPGGIGITRYVCEQCGHVSISVGDD